MASVSADPHGTRRVQFTGPDGRRRTVRLGKLPKRGAEELAGVVERLTAAALAGHAPDDATARRVAALPDATHAKLAACGLIPGRASDRLGPFLAAYLADRSADVKPPTLRHLRESADALTGFLGPDRPLREITPADADGFRRHLTRKGLGPNTVNRRMGRANQFLRAAHRAELLDRNPFAGQKTTVRANPARQHFVTAADAARVLDACPDDRWRLIFSLARWGGLRVPSELTPLTWGDVDWDAGKLRVTSPKTAHHEGKGERTIPLFPELRRRLEPLRDPAAPPSAPLLTGGLTAPHLRRDFLKVLGRAGLDPWPKLFHNLRATRQTELAATFPVHVVCDWIGNTAAVAAEHYLTTTAEDFERAAFSERTSEPGISKADAESDARATQNPTLTGADPKRPEPTPPTKMLAGKGESHARSVPVTAGPLNKVPPEGIEPSTY